MTMKLISRIGKKMSRILMIIFFYGVLIWGITPDPVLKKITPKAKGFITRNFRGGGTFTDWNANRIEELILDYEKALEKQQQLISEKQMLEEEIQPEELEFLKEIEEVLQSLRDKQKKNMKNNSKTP